MRQFEYVTPRSKEQAVELLGANWSDAAVLGGGTDLLALMKDDVVAPHRLVNVKKIALLNEARFSGDTLHIGALVTMGMLAENKEIAHALPMLHEALLEAASPQIRNRATIAGNLCQRPRCWYFRNGMGLLATDASGESLVLKGDNRYHAVLGNEGPAYFVSPSTIGPALIAYDARVRIQSPHGAREIALADFYRIPRSAEEREHALAPNEIVTDVFVPVPKYAKTGFYEVRQKEAFDWPAASCAVRLEMSGATVSSARVVLGQVAPKPWVSKEAAEALVGKSVNEETAMAAANAALASARSLGHNRQKITLAKVAVKRAILKALA